MPVSKPILQPISRSVLSPLRGRVGNTYAGHNMVVFDGTNDYLNRGALFTGAVDARYMTLAFKIKPMKAVGTIQNILHFGAANARIVVDVSNKIAPLMSAAGFGTVTVGGTNATAMTTGTAYTCHLAFDFVSGAQPLFWLNGVDDKGSLAFGGTQAAATFASGGLAQTAIAASNSGAGKFEGQLGFFWFTVGNTTASYITDPTKFYSGGDVDLGTDGTGSGLTQPVIFFGGRNTAADWNGTPGTASAVNKGSGADNWTMAVDGVT